MRLLLVNCFSLLVASQCFSQIQTSSLSSKDSIRVSLKKIVSDKLPGTPLKKVIVLDARPEIGSIGYLNLDQTIAQKYFFKATAEKELTKWFNDYLQINPQNKNGSTLLINIKKLRVSKNVLQKTSQPGLDTLTKTDRAQGVVAKIEFFLEQDSFFVPLYRFDSTFFITGKLPKNVDDFLITALTSSLSIFLSIDPVVMPVNKRKILLDDIIHSNNQMKDLPINKETTLKRGIYKTFEEFKMNAPSITDYEFRKGSSGTTFINENGNLQQVNDIWGVCDGENYFINLGYSYSKLIRTENSFYFSGSKSIIIKLNKKVNPELVNFGWTLLDFGLFGYFDPTNRINMDTPAYTYDLIPRHYQLDMETGDFY